MHSAISLSTDNIIVTKTISIDRDLENYALCRVIACNKCIIKNVTLKNQNFRTSFMSHKLCHLFEDISFPHNVCEKTCTNAKYVLKI